ncbi:Vacuolar protein sorting-associated protein 53 [Clydaea vesicula]|uniref:Vacuolar protein sorting-associated protein 53 n=1 Tax=Clydaea vesicula TaxID=447962 RepID=A0AAD5TYC5_9FUNG|nr:Vacuolar protein sorting-associated protein 53 [Clydaea vesicula]
MFNENLGYEKIQLSNELDIALNNFIKNDDLGNFAFKIYDHSSDFSITEYINEIFKTEESLTTIDVVLMKLRTQIIKIDKEINSNLTNQFDAGQHSEQELASVKKNISLLYEKIKTMKENALKSESMRLQMIVLAMNQLKIIAKNKQYSDTSQLLLAIKQLLINFENFKNVKQVQTIIENMNRFEADLKKQIFMDFEESFVGGTLRTPAKKLYDACLVVDILHKDEKKHLIDWYCEMQLKDYIQIFRNNPEVSGLADVSRRYAWIKRLLKTYDEEHATTFIQEWKVPEILCEKFCLVTKKDITEVLNKSGANKTIDVKTMLVSLQTTMEFEAKLDKRFGIKDYSETGFQETAIDPSSKFYKIISSCYAPYLEYYIESENKALSEMMQQYREQPIETSDQQANEDSVLPSSTDLFYCYRQTMVQFSRFSTGKPFLDLSKLFKKWLSIYSELLLSKLPREDLKKISEEEIRVTCVIINTADYCTSTTAQVNILYQKCYTKTNGLISWKRSWQKKLMWSLRLFVTSSALKILVKCIGSSVDPALYNMSKVPWGSIESVGDQSEYITMIAQILSQLVGTVKKSLGGPKFFKTFCDKFADALLVKFEANIYKCKPVPEVAAEQMLLDTHALKTILVQMTNIGSQNNVQPPSSYTKILTKGVLNVEKLLKTVMIPSDPAEGLIDRYLMMYTGDVSVSGFQKILEVKGLRRGDQQLMIDVLQNKLANLGPAAEILYNKSTNEENKKSNADLLGQNEKVSNKLKEDISKFFKFK